MSPVLRSHLGWGAAVTVLALVGRLTVVGSGLSLVWPAAGAAFLWLLQQHGRAGSAIATSGTAASIGAVMLATGASTVLAVTAVVVNVGQSVLAVRLVRRWCPELLGAGGTGGVHGPAVLLRSVTAVALATGAGALLASTVLGLGGTVSPGAGLLDWWARNLTGVVVVAAVGHLRWERVAEQRGGAGRRWVPAGRRLELVGLLVGSLAAYGAVFALQTGLPLAFLLMVPAVWVASRFGTLLAVLHTTALGAFAVVLSVVGRGPFALLPTAQDQALVLQAFLLTVLMTALAVATGRDEREALTASLGDALRTTARRAELLDAMTDTMDEGLVVLGPDGVVLRANPAARELLALTETGFRSSFREYATQRPDGTPLPFEEHPAQRALREGRVAAQDVVLRDAGGGDRVLSVTAAPLFSGRPGSGPTASLVVHRDVTAERHQQARLADFAAVAAHDLRNPLTAVGGWVDLARLQVARSGGADPVALDRALDRAHLAVDRMAALIDDLLAQAYAEGGTLDPAEAALHGADGLFAEVGAEVGLEIDLRDGPWPPVLVDADLVQQLLTNLLGNARKYVEPGVEPRVRVSAHQVGTRLVVRVEDNGIGVPDGHHHRVFERFHRAHPDDQAYAGTGLGLAICRTVVQRHDGAITCTPGPGGGTAFTFDLPLGPARPAGR